MKAAITVMFLAMLVSGCGKSADSLEAQERLNLIPGYREARVFCTQCHKLPVSNQHVPAAWPGVIVRMEGNMRANNRKVPTQQEREAIIGYFQSNPG